MSVADVISSEAAQPAADGPTAWIFQANPNRYDLAGALQELSVIDWEVNQSHRQIHRGHRVYLWQAGRDAGVLAHAEVLTEPSPIPPEVRGDVFSLQPGSADNKPRVWLRVLRVLDDPLFKTELLEDERTADLGIIRFANATNFGLTDVQAKGLTEQFDARAGRDVQREKLFFFTASSKIAAHHMQISLIEGVPLEIVGDITELAGRFARHARDGRVYAWGARPGSAAEQKWQRLNPGDIGLVYADGEFSYWGRVYAKARSEAVARKVWSADESGQVWECMFFLDPVEPLQVARENMVAALGYQRNYIPQGFEIPSGEVQAQLLERCPTLREFISSFAVRGDAQPPASRAVRSAGTLPFETVPALRIGYAHRILTELGGRGPISISNLFSAVDPESLFKSEREHRAPVDRARDLLQFSRRLGLVQQSGQDFALTGAGEEYVTAIDDADLWEVSSDQSRILRIQLAQLYRSEGVLGGAALMLSIMSTVPSGRVTSFEELGHALGRAAGRTEWRSERTFRAQGERFGLLLNDMKLAADAAITSLGREVLDRLDLPDHSDFLNLLGDAQDDVTAGSVWWVNQGSTYAWSRDHSCLWAPQLNRAGRHQASWDRLLEARRGDVVIHYASGSIRAVGRVTAEATDATRPEGFPAGESWQDKGWLVEVDYRELSRPIQLGSIPPESRTATAGPFTTQGSAQQGYFFPLSDEFVHVLARLFPELGLATGSLPDGVALEQQPDYEEPELSAIFGRVLASGMRLDEQTLRRYHVSLKTRGFVVLSGLSGSGKTWLAELYAEVVGAQSLLVPVAPNWTTNEDLLGYLDPITQDYRHTPFSGFLIEAAAEYESAKRQRRRPKPFHLILDEMNLARVEYYFAKFLSAMELRARKGTAALELSPKFEVLLTPNLMFVGTVNIDETTHGFADKVYDRAQLIEIPVPRSGIEAQLGQRPYAQAILKVWDAMRPVAPFAYRVVDEIAAYVTAAEALNVGWEAAVDEQLLQKVLPKVKGTEPAIGPALETFLGLANGRWPLCHTKTTKMLAAFREHGFVAYF